MLLSAEINAWIACLILMPIQICHAIAHTNIHAHLYIKYAVNVEFLSCPS